MLAREENVTFKLKEENAKIINEIFDTYDKKEAIKNQTYENDKCKVQQNGMSLCDVKNQTDEICKLAVQQNGMVIQYVQNQTDEICFEAIKNNNKSVNFVETMSNELRLMIIGYYGLNKRVIE